MAEFAPDTRLQEIEDRLEHVAAKLIDAAVHSGRDGNVGGAIGSQLSTVKAMLTAIESRLGSRRVRTLPRPAPTPEPVARSLEDTLGSARERAERVLQKHYCWFRRERALCQPCGVEFPCDARRAAEDVLAICDAVVSASLTTEPPPITTR